MAETWRHAGAVVIGTTAERGAFDTSVLRPDNRWFDTDLSAFLLWEGTAWVHRFADNVVLYDDAGDSPSLTFMGGANDDTVTLFLDDDAIIGRSDLIVQLADALSQSRMVIWDSGGNPVSWLDSDGNAYFLDTVGIGTETVPHGAVGFARLALDGANASASGPHIQLTTASDDYPLFQVLGWQHDNIALAFDAYWDNNFRSSDAGSNYRIYKLSDQLVFTVASGHAQGADIGGNWDTVIYLDTSSYVGLSISPTVRLDVYGTDQPSSTIRLHRLEAAATGPTFILHQTRGGAAAGVIGDDLGYIQFEGHDNLGNDALYAQIDAEIVDPQNPIEAGRLYLRTMQAGIMQSALELTTYGVINNLTDLRGVGANAPDLGTTTAAEKIGNVYQAAAHDVYPCGDDADLFASRVSAYNLYTDHFIGGVLGGAWAWAGAPFIGVPGFLDVSQSRVAAGLTVAVLQRAFYFQAATPTNASRAMVAMQALAVNSFTGIRWDDGTDNNYVEVGINLSAALPTTWTFRVRWVVGGGAVNTIDGSVVVVPSAYLLEIQAQGALWANWGISFLVKGNNGIGGLSGFWQTANNPNGFTWTPTRIGITLEKPGAAVWYRFFADSWFNN